MRQPPPRRARRRSSRRAGRLTIVGALIVVAVVVGILVGGSRPRRAWTCVSANSLQTLAQWRPILGRQIDCAVAFTDAAPDWQGWQRPWITGYRHNVPQYDWVDWYQHGRHGRHLIVTQSLIPSDLKGTDWLLAGARGEYEPYARTLARNLIAAGMGNVIIRLGHEANGTWYPDSLPDNPTGDAQWVQLWRDTVTAMRSVPGAHFRFDWCVNAGVRNIPLGSFYPGNRYVDIIGVDAYDSLPNPKTPLRGGRVQTILGESDGLLAVRRFARDHGKPLSIPEWGLGPAGQGGTIGNDPRYVEAIARVVRAGGVLYQSYFTGGAEGTALLHAPSSLAAYRRAFARGH